MRGVPGPLEDADRLPPGCLETHPVETPLVDAQTLRGLAHVNRTTGGGVAFAGHAGHGGRGGH